MTKIDDKALDELHREAVRYVETGNYARSRRVMVSDRDKAITALRAKVKELERKIEKVNGWSVSDWAAGRRRAVKEARQVTREQRDKCAEALGWYARPDAREKGIGVEMANQAAAFFGLKIVEEAPKAERRECDCSMLFNGKYACRKSTDEYNNKTLVRTRCTITEGGDNG